jgi:hypothetical protein
MIFERTIQHLCPKMFVCLCAGTWMCKCDDQALESAIFFFWRKESAIYYMWRTYKLCSYCSFSEVDAFDLSEKVDQVDTFVRLGAPFCSHHGLYAHGLVSQWEKRWLPYSVLPILHVVDCKSAITSPTFNLYNQQELAITPSYFIMLTSGAPEITYSRDWMCYKICWHRPRWNRTRCCLHSKYPFHL